MGVTPTRDLFAELGLSPQLLFALRTWQQRAKERAEQREAENAERERLEGSE